MLRRSNRIASTYGPVYSNLPSVATIRRQKKAKDIWSFAKSMKAALLEEKKNPLTFEGDLQFDDPWAARRYVKNPSPDGTYDVVRIAIVREGHTGDCADPEEWSHTEGIITLHFTPFTKTDRKKPLFRGWKKAIPGHEECGAVIRYSVLGMERVPSEPIQVCPFCDKKVEYMEWCLCQLAQTLTATVAATAAGSQRSCIHCHTIEAECWMAPCTEEFHDIE